MLKVTELVAALEIHVHFFFFERFVELLLQCLVGLVSLGAVGLTASLGAVQPVPEGACGTSCLNAEEVEALLALEKQNQSNKTTSVSSYYSVWLRCAPFIVVSPAPCAAGCAGRAARCGEGLPSLGARGSGAVGAWHGSARARPRNWDALV